MRSTYAGLALVALAAAKPVPQSSSSCSGDYPGTFKIQVVKTSGKVKRQDDSSALVISLSGGVLTDSEGRTGYIAANHQFQFDAPVQAGALQEDNFNVCGGYLAHGDVTTWDQCLSGNFYNLYDDNSIAAGNPGQCEEINIMVIGDSSSAAPATTSVPVTQISDGQPQASTAVPAPVTQISDGQIQATTATPVAPVTQITDGQIQAPTSTPVAPVTQISDGQIQAPTSTPVAPVTQISDGQVQAPTSAPYPSGTGMMPMPTGTGVMPSSTYAPIPATGSGSTYTVGGSIFGAVAAVVALMF